MSSEKNIVRNLAKRYAEIAALPIQDEKRKLWSAHNALKPTRPMILLTYGMWNIWCQEVFGDAQMKCADPFLRGLERTLRMQIFQHEGVGDDSIQQPWFSVGAHHAEGGWGWMWGVDEGMHHPGVTGGAAAYNPPIKTWDDMARLRMVHHKIDEAATARTVEQVHDILGDILPIDIVRTPGYSAFMADISTSLAKLRGLEQLMVDMYESPKELHQLLAFMRDSILANNQEAEDAGHYSLSSAGNQSMPYADGLAPLAPNSPCKRNDIWGFCAAQEYTLISPAFHEEFLFQYQKPIIEHYALSHYGCCEDLGEKIDMLRKLKNLRSVAVAPLANVRRCAEQLGQDYIMSWRPNPTDMVCYGYDESLITRIVTQALADGKDGNLHIHLKDVETVQGDPTRLSRWVTKVRQITM